MTRVDLKGFSSSALPGCLQGCCGLLPIQYFGQFLLASHRGDLPANSAAADLCFQQEVCVVVRFYWLGLVFPSLVPFSISGCLQEWIKSVFGGKRSLLKVTLLRGKLFFHPVLLHQSHIIVLPFISQLFAPWWWIIQASRGWVICLDNILNRCWIPPLTKEVWVTKLPFVFSKAEFDKLILNHVSQT